MVTHNTRPGVTERGLALIRQYEGFSATPYICPAGLKTIGYGHVIKPSENFPEGGISQEMAEILLKQDVGPVETAILRFVTARLTQAQFDALGSLVYNIGIQAFEKSTLLRLLNTGQPEKAALEFKKWVFCKGQRLSGLVTRRNAEANLFVQKSPFIEL